ncbi:MAG: hypothetical protein GX102_10160 [Porphyromonadaceae bacterium]|nr:hypothetical protein [Porphyromonadaceae bacterium]
MKKTLFFFAILLLPFITFISCEKSDKYIDWKVINDEWYEANKNSLDVLTESGLAYRRIGPEANPAERKPNPNDVVWLNITGSYIDGIEFQKETNEMKYIPNLNKGLQEGILKMVEGEVYTFYIPYKIGYGTKTGDFNVPPYSTLKYTVKLIRSQAY